MCGIVGIFGIAGIAGDELPRMAETMLGLIGHRGPDEVGYVVEHDWMLGNARLSIIDLAGGHQPMPTVDDRYWLSYNGEIFNYLELRAQLATAGVTFRTRSDTEVLLLALVHWGRGALDRLDGQFAFAFYDRHTGYLLLARDRLGERPLFIWRRGAAIALASEIKALLAVPAAPRGFDPAGIAETFRLWAPLPPRTAFEGVEQLPPGTWMERTRGEWRTGTYGYSDGESDPPASFEAAAELTRATLTEAVRLRMRSDVEVGVYLSGGLDSTIVTALAARMTGRPLRSFSVGFEDAAFDERKWQAQAAAATGTRHHGVVATRDDLRDAFLDAIYHAEAPQFRTALIPLFLLAKAVRQAGIRVVLSGEGADETFLGYDIFKEAAFLARFHEFPDDDARARHLAKLYPYLPHFQQREAQALVRLYASVANQARGPLRAFRLRFALGEFAGRMLKDPVDVAAQDRRLTELLAGSAGDDVRQACLLERATLLHGYLLSSQGDRMTSAHGVEGRCPFLSPAVVGLADRIPTAWHLEDGLGEKSVLKAAFAGVVPSEIRLRAKQPYRAPGAAMLRRGQRDDWIADYLSDESLSRLDLIDGKAARQIVERIDAAPDDGISPRLDQAYILLLSLVALDRRLLRGAPRGVFAADRLAVRRDLRLVAAASTAHS